MDSVQEFLEARRGSFAMTTWALDLEPVEVYETT